ncbi:zinc finger protein 85-like [Uloborus diversus]|uniref:zinc finger protein 85-like n=1 Tax=Uloborus diversus TaxID=327109 RepID=UPI002409BB40|nr:zinc finger protein 85-like [Uloborus diversus]
MKFKSINSLNIHSFTHGKRKKLSCEFCAEVFPSEKHLKEHFKSHGIQVPKYVCLICGVSFCNSANVSRHMKSIHLNFKQHKCSKCGREYSRRDHLKIHEKTHLRGRKIKCNICPQTFRYKKELENHIAVHDEVKKFESSYTTKMKLVLTDCMSNKHNPNPDKTSNTDVDTLPEPSKPNTSNEAKLNPSDNISETETMRKSSSGAKSNSLHAKKESDGLLPNKTVKKSKITKEKEVMEVFDCEHCEKCFKTENILIRHKQVCHPIEIEDYVCDQCGETFLERFNLDVHKMSHDSTALLHKCKKCDSSFVRKSLLTSHVKKVHE